MGGALYDAPDRRLQEGKLHSRWKPLTILRDFLQLPKLFTEKLSSRTVLVTYWVCLLFSEDPLEDVLMCSLRSFHIDGASVLAKCLLTMVFPMSV